MEEIKNLVSKINGGDNATLKILYGNDISVLQKQALRYKEVLIKFQETYQSDKAALFSSPGRSEIGGNHTDHNHGRVLAGAINLDNVAAAATNSSNIINILSVGYHPFKVDISEISHNKDGFFSSASLVKGICSRMKDLGFSIGGFDAIIDGDVPKGSGLSSSASFEVLIGTILSHLFNEGKLDPVTNAIIGQYAENNFFGKPCGLMDQTACVVGGFITIDFEDPSMPVVKKVDFDFTSTGYALVITDTGGNHADLNEEYASLPIEMKSVAANLGAKVLRDVSLEQIVERVERPNELAEEMSIMQECVRKELALQPGLFSWHATKYLLLLQILPLLRGRL